MNISISSVTTAENSICAFTQKLEDHGLGRLTRDVLSELQVNVGRLCNQACEHCHVDAGPKRKEIMTWATMQKILAWTRENDIKRVDITGGAPEMNPHFREFVDAFIDMGTQVTARCNLTVLYEPGQDGLARWYADRKVRLVCSLPCYSEINVDQQRGKGVFGKSIKALQELNAEGYARNAVLPLDLVYNPNGPSLPPDQATLEAAYKQRLFDDFGIEFNNLLTLTNLPINRFAHYLRRTGQFDSYYELLMDNFNAQTVSALMCRHLLSIDWLGKVYDCDFNQMLDLPLDAAHGDYLWDIDSKNLKHASVIVGAHCFGCTAGAGSSCGGALTS